MNEIIGYLRNYIQSVNRSVFLFTTLFIAIAITCNYTLGINTAIVSIQSWPLRTTGFFLLFAFVFSAAWLLQLISTGRNIIENRFFFVLLLVAPVIFAAKVTFDQAAIAVTHNLQPPWDQYWNKVLAWPLKFLLVLVLVAAIWKWGRFPQPLAGVQLRGFNVQPYFLLLLCMVPLIAFAATRSDFLHTYPKVQRIDFIDQYIPIFFPLAIELRIILYVLAK